jgi:hypothetical protein
MAGKPRRYRWQSSSLARNEGNIRKTTHESTIAENVPNDVEPTFTWSWIPQYAAPDPPIGAYETGPVVLAVSTPPKSSSPFGLLLEVLVGAK